MRVEFQKEGPLRTNLVQVTRILPHAVLRQRQLMHPLSSKPNRSSGHFHRFSLAVDMPAPLAVAIDSRNIYPMHSYASSG